VTREDEDGLLAGEFNGIPSRRDQPNQQPWTYNWIQYSNRPDNQENSRGRMKLQETSSNQRRIPVQPMHLKVPFYTKLHQLPHKPRSWILKEGTDVQNSKNPLIDVLVKKSMKQIASNLNVENTQTRTKSA
jgi:hypothetical protein